MISVIMPSFLGHYPGAATNREFKLCRAIESFMAQQLGELIVISDACEKTVEIAQRYPVRIFKLHKKQPSFSGDLRQIGINLARFDWIAYLDSDDVLGKGHLRSILDNAGNDWLWWDDIRAGKPNPCQLAVNHIGTSCIAHRRELPVYWDHGYKHDWRFIQQLMNYNGKKISANYHVMHVPGLFDE
jgi:glycosyltransferase involved in cell wall biosynthesis